MTFDQVHKQSNEKISEVHGAKHVLNCKGMSGDERWETCSPDLAKIIESFEVPMATDFDAKENSTMRVQ